MKNLISLKRSGMGPDGMSRKGRHAIGSNLSRLCLASLICLCMLTVGVGNAWGANATMTGGTNATASTFSSASGYKCGTGKAGGSMTVTIPANATVLSVYIAAWNGESPSVSISRSSGTISSSSVSPSSDSGISGSGTSYTLANAESTYLQTFTLSNVGSETTVTFSTSAKNKRFGVWGAKICYSPTSPTNTTIGSTTATLGWSDAKNVNSYEVYYSTSSTPPTASSSGTTTTSKSINLTSLTSSQQYYWWVRAYDSYCKSAWVAGSSFTTTSGASCADPSAPGNSSVSGTGVTISTSSSSANYDIYYSTSSTTPTTQDPTATISSGNSKAITGLSYGTTYYYWMRKNCGGGSTSSWVAGSPTTFTTTVPAPTGVSAGSLTMDGATFTITDANDVNNYDIYYSTNSTAPVAGTTPSTTSTSKTKAVSGLAAGTYYYWVRAKGPNAKSDWVGGSTFTTLTLSSIAVSTAPTKTKYLVGDNFDPTALVITRTYSNSTSDTYSYAGHTSEFTFSPATNAALTAGDDAVTITYGGKSVSQSINVYSVTVNKVDMDGNAIADAGVTASCSGRTLSQSVGSTNYKFNSWVLATASGTSLSTNTLTGTPTGNVVVNAKFHKPITVTWKVGSGAASGGTSEVKYGTAISALPSTPADNALASCGTNKFMGWTALGELKGTGNDAPADLFTTVGGAANLTTNTTYRAVFASSTSGAAANTVLFEEPFTGMTADTKPTSPGSSATVYGSATITYTFTNGTGTSSGTTAIKNEALTQSGSAPEVMVGKKGTSSGAAGGTVVITGIPNGGASALTVSYTQNANGLSATASGTGYSGSTSGNSKTDKSFDVTVSSNADPTLTLTFQATSTSNVRLDDIKVKVKTAGTTAVDYQTGCCEAPPALSITSANSVATGGTVSLTSTGGNGGTVTWSVVNGTGTATVAGTTLTAGSIGTVTVKAHQDANTVLGTEYCAQDAEQAFTVVSSTIHVTGVEVSPTTKAIVPGETFDITPTISPSNATDKSVSWTSSASDKASVSSGTVTGVAAGTATITCTTTDGSYTATTAVTVYGVTMQALDEDGNAIAVGGPGTPSRTGASISPAADAGNYVFKEWAISGASLGSSASTKANTITNPTGAVTVTAKYYKPRVVKWSVNGDDSYDEGSPTLTVAYNGTISAVPDAPDDDALSCANKFMGWSTKSAGATPKTTSYYDDLFTNASGYTTGITDATKTFYAVFAEVDEGNWTLDYSEEDDLSGSTSWGSYGTAYDYTASDGGTWTVKAYKNAGMQINTTKDASIKIPDCSGDITSIEITCSAAKAVGLSASDYTGSGVITYIAYGTDATSQTIDCSSKTATGGYIVPKSGSTSITKIVVNYGSASDYVTECDATKAKVTYDLNGGTGGCATGLYTKDGFTVCNTAVTKTGYTFSGWNDGTSTYAAGAAYTLTTNVTFTAQWTPVEYTITYNLDGGTNNIGNPASYTIESSDITLLTPTKTAGGYEYDFTGWTDDDDSDAPITTIASGSTGDKHVTATWAQKKRVQWYVGNTVQWTTFYASDGSGSLSLPNGGTPPSVPPTCGSKVFVGWTSDTPWDGETDTEPTVLFKAASGTVSDDANYYAVWADEHSEEAEGEIFSDAFNISGTDEVTSRDGWSSLSKLYGGSGSIRFSTGGGAGTMTLVKTGLGFGTTVTEATITFKIKKYGSDGSGVLSVSSNFSDATTTFSKDGGKTTSTSAQYSTTDGSNWTTCTCTVGSISASTDIILEGQTNSRVYVKDFSIEASGTTYTYDKYAIVCCNDPELAFGQTRYSLIREDLHGNTSGAYSTIELTYSSESSGTIRVWNQYDEDDNPEHSTKTAWQYTGANTWGTSPTTGGTAATASTHAYFEITDAANGKAKFYVKNTAGNTQGQGTYRVALHQAANGSYCETVTYCWIDVTLRDKFVDAVNGNTFPNADGHGPGGAAVSTPAENTRDADKDDDCHETTRRLVGWVKETDMDTWYGSSSDRTRDLDDKKDDAKLVAPGATITTSGATWYAVWGIEE